MQLSVIYFCHFLTLKRSFKHRKDIMKVLRRLSVENRDVIAYSVDGYYQKMTDGVASNSYTNFSNRFHLLSKYNTTDNIGH